MSLDWMYTAVESFGPWRGEAWRSYIEWSGFTHLRELISFDSILCPSVVRELVAEDWDHIVAQDYRVPFFRDLDYLIQRVAGDGRCNILAILENPEPNAWNNLPVASFVRRGLDVMDGWCAVSVLTNCGGFDGRIRPSDLSADGLVDDLNRACALRDRLRQEFPNDPHAADCNVWMICRWEGPR